jgi:DNA polymerase elongation subunit (family B)
MKILLLDIETAPHMAAVWGLWNQNVATSQLLKPGYTLCWAAKWYHEKEILFDSIQSGHKSMIRRIHRLMSESDVIVHYNGLKFDIPTLNREFLVLGLNPPAPSAHVDLLRVARRRFRLASNKLDFVAKSLGFKGKEQHKGFELWLECMARKPEAWDTMERYNTQDVVLLEQVYDRLKPWIQSHPSHSAYEDATVCPNCGSEKRQSRGFAMSRTLKYRRFQCGGCGTWYRSSKAEKRGSERMVGVS